MSTALRKEFLSRNGQDTARLPALLPTAAGATRLFFNRELSLLEFHKRVLEEGLDQSNPVLERLKFLAIFSSNLDEFFMIRVSGLKEELEENVTELSLDGMTPEEQLREIRVRALPMLKKQTRCLHEQILPELEAAGIHVLDYNSLEADEQKVLRSYFMEKVFPILTPPGHSPADPKQRHKPRFVRIKVPSVVPRLVPVGKFGTKFVLLEELIEANLESLFPGMITGRCHRFRVTRDADIEIREDEAEDLLRLIQRELRQRRFGTPVRLEVSAGMPEEMIAYLTESLDLSSEDVYVSDGPLKLQDFMSLYDLNRPDLKDESFSPTRPEWRNKESIFDILKARDVLLHHPYDSYDSVTDFINEAIEDPEVVAIKICLYRTGPDSPIPPALIRAAEKGKQI